MSEPDASSGATAQAFIAKWQGVSASELSTAQSFTAELCDLLGVPKPHPTAELDYMFERPVTFAHGDGSSSAGRIDCYRRGHFVLEAKKLKAAGHTKGFDDALLRARAQAEGYARALPVAEGRPPFLLVVDVGNVIEVYAEFSRSGATYTPFPDPRSHRITLADLTRPELRERLRAIWTAPDSLNPAHASARVTREVSAQLALLAKSLESAGHKPEHVAAFLTRCLFSMFAEDVALLPKNSFLGLLQSHRANPATLLQMLRVLWTDMDSGGFSAALATPVLRFNGKLFKQPLQDGYVLLLNQEQIDHLITAARANWREVEPAIFGTLLERALSPTERHALGAHYTPRAYVERLVLPTVMQPLRADWANAQAAAVLLAGEGKLKEACAEVRRFHHQLCTTRVLDPACGSGNFLYVTLEHLKRLEGEVLNQLAEFGETQDKLGFEGETVTLQQLRGIEINERAAALAELVLWIGFLQWHIRTRGNQAVAEPVVHDYGNIECRDAVLAWSAQEPMRDAQGHIVSRWDGSTFKTHPVTGAQVPDEAAQVPQWTYLSPRKATWPQADFIVGNPPFIGAASMRAALGDGYVEALRGVWRDVPESADFVMYWWHQAAGLVSAGAVLQFGLITTNSLRQTFNRRVVSLALSAGGASSAAGSSSPAVEGSAGAGTGHAGDLMLPNAQKSAARTPRPGAGVSLVFAIPDHPWVDSANGAAVRIAMTVGSCSARDGRLLSVVNELPGNDGEIAVSLREQTGLVHADLSVGANVASAVALLANGTITSRGVMLFGAGFILTFEEADALGASLDASLKQRLIRDYRNGRDLTDAPRQVKVIDAYGMNAEQLRTQAPAVYQHLLQRVKPERDTNRDKPIRESWWLHGRTRGEIRTALYGLPRYIATVETAKHRTFQFLDASVLPDNMLIAIASSDAHHLGVLSSEVHITWALAQGGTLEDRPRYNKSRCFETFPFPDQNTGLTPALREKITALAEQIDAHRKRVLSPGVGGSVADIGIRGRTPAHPPPATPLATAKAPTTATHSTAAATAPLTLTGLYNVLQALREGRALSAKEKTIHTHGLVSVLKELHDELDAAVLQAYGWPTGLSRDELLGKLVALNAQRAAEEKTGQVRWLRPAFQNPQPRANTGLLQNTEQTIEHAKGLQAEMTMHLDEIPPTATQTPAAQPWPATLPEQVRAVANALTRSPQSVPELEAHFKGRGPWKKSLPRILETLEALGRARRELTESDLDQTGRWHMG